MDFQAIRQLLEPDLNQVNALILNRLQSNVALVNQIGQYIVYSGGKRIRPLLVVLVARACGYQGTAHWDLAAIIEFIHTATLLHDDVVDESSLRRGQQTANDRFGNAPSVLVGDFLYSRAFQMMTALGRMPIMQILSDATNLIAEGEVLQLMNCRDPDTTEERYMEVIHCKTAKLFEAAAELGALISDVDPAVFARYGCHLGTAFQLVDDVLDYRASAEEMGKNLGDDLAEGKPTLPLIHALRTGNAEQQALLRRCIEQGGLDQLEEIQQIVETTGALDYSMQVARVEAEKARDCLAQLPESDYKNALIALTYIAVDRTQ